MNKSGHIIDITSPEIYQVLKERSAAKNMSLRKYVNELLNETISRKKIAKNILKICKKLDYKIWYSVCKRIRQKRAQYSRSEISKWKN